MAKDAEASLILKIKAIGGEAIGKVSSSLGDMKEKAALASAAFLGFLGVSVKSYAEAEAAANSLSSALKAQGLDVEGLSTKYAGYAAAIQKKTAFGDDELIQALALAQGMAGNLELTEDLIKATVDFAAATGQDLQSAFAVVGKSIGTNANALGRYGVELDDSMTKEEKMTVITADLTKKFDGMAESQVEGLGSIKQMNNALGDIFETIGEQVAPVVVNLAKFVTKLAEKMQDKTFAKFVAVVASIGAGATALIATLGGIGAALGPISAGFALLAGPAGWIVLATTAIAAMGTAWATNFGDIQQVTFGVFGALESLFTNFVSNVGNLFSDFGSLLKGVFTFDIDQIKASIGSIKDHSENIIKDTVKAYEVGFASRSKSLEKTIKTEEKTEKKAALNTAAEKIKANAEVKKDRETNAEKIHELENQLEDEKIASARAKQKEYLDLSHKEFLAAEKAKIDAAEEMEKAHQDFVKQLNDASVAFLSKGLQDATESLVSSLTEKFLPGFGSAAGAAFKLLSMESEEFKNTFEQFFSTDFLQNIVKNIPTFFKVIIDKLPDITQALITAIIKAAPQISVSLAKAVTDPKFQRDLALAVFYGFKDGILDALDKVRDAIHEALNFDLPNGKHIEGGALGKVFGFNSGGIVRRMAGGGVVDSQMIMARAGEAVIPAQTVQNNPQAVGALLSGRSPSGGSGGMVININAYGGLLGNDADARKFAQKIDSELLKLRRDKSSVAFDSAVY